MGRFDGDDVQNDLHIGRIDKIISDKFTVRFNDQDEQEYTHGDENIALINDQFLNFVWHDKRVVTKAITKYRTDEIVLAKVDDKVVIGNVVGTTPKRRGLKIQCPTIGNIPSEMTCRRKDVKPLDGALMNLFEPAG